MDRTYRRIVGSVLPVLAFSLLGVVGAIAAEDAAKEGEVVYLAEMDAVSGNRKTGECMLNTVRYPRSIGPYMGPAAVTTINDELVFNLGRAYDRFEAVVGVDDHEPDERRAFQFVVLGDNQSLFASEFLKAGDTPVPISISVKGVLRLKLQIKEQERIYGTFMAYWGDPASSKAPVAVSKNSRSATAKRWLSAGSRTRSTSWVVGAVVKPAAERM
jgi:hypothetical protein